MTHGFDDTTALIEQQSDWKQSGKRPEITMKLQENAKRKYKVVRKRGRRGGERNTDRRFIEN